MKTLLKLQRVKLTVVFIFMVSTLIGCSSAENLQSQVSGTWDRTQGDGTVEINLAKDPNILKLYDKIYPASIAKIDKGTFTVYLKVETTAGQMEDWTLRQIWDDNGSSFKIDFHHNGTKEILEARTNT
jgi:hypothetical protein